MGDSYYDYDQRQRSSVGVDTRRADDYTTTIYRSSRSRSRPRRGSEDYRRHHSDRNYDRSHSRDPTMDIVKYTDYDDRDGRVVVRRHRSLSPSYIRDDEYSQPRRHHHHHRHRHDDDRSYRGFTDRSANHHKDHHTGKDLVATVLGGVVGGAAAKKASDGSRLAGLAGVLAGAWGGHELERNWEGHEAKEHARERRHER